MIRFIKILPILLSLLAVAMPARPDTRPLSFRRLTTENGLSSSFVNAIRQDPEGFLWIATTDGLNRFDGYAFRTYRTRAGDRTSLSSNVVHSLHVDRMGRLWAGTQNGLHLYDRRNDRFIRFRNTEAGVFDVTDIAECGDGTVVLSSSSRIYRADPGDSLCVPILSRLLEARGVRPADFHRLEVDRDGRFWIGLTNSGLLRVDSLAGSVQSFRSGAKPGNGLRSDRVHSLFTDSAGILWAGTDAGVLRFDPVSGVFRVFRKESGNPESLSNDICWDLFPDGPDGLWVATQNGLNRLDRSDGKVRRFPAEPARPGGLHNGNIQSVFQDRSGVLWLGGTRGLEYAPQGGNPFRTFRNNPGDSRSLSHNSVTCFSPDGRGGLWIGTDGGGLNRFDPKTGRFATVRQNASGPGGSATNAVLALWTAADAPAASLWIGDYMDGLGVLDPETGRFRAFPSGTADPSGAGFGDVRSILRDRRGRMWIATNGRGLFRMDRPGGQRFSRFTHDPENPTGSLVSDFCLTLLEDRDGGLWIGTYVGLCRYDEETGRFTSYMSVDGDSTSLSHNWVYALHEDGKGRLWVGTYSGLNRLDRNNGVFSRFGLRNGFPSEVINGLLEDGRGRLWFSTNAGLVRFNPETFEARVYTRQDGLQGDEFIHGACVRLPGGEMAFGGTDGFTLFHPDSVSERTTEPSPVITAVEVMAAGNRPDRAPAAARKPPLADGGVRLSHVEAKMFTVFFTAPEFIKPGKIRYRYRLDGYHDGWIDAGAGRSATFTNLDPGGYTFRVSATNTDGVWSPAEAKIRVTLDPPFWKSPWAMLLYLLLGASAVFAYHRYQANLVRLRSDLREQTLEKEKALELDALQSRFFANISHEFRTPLTLILAPLREIASAGREMEWPLLQSRLHVMQRSAERMLRLVNQVIDFNRIEAGRMTLERREADLVSFCRGVADTFTLLAADRQVTFTFGSNRPAVTAWFDPDKLDTVVFNLLSNAFKYAPRGGSVSMTVRAAAGPGAVEISVEDSGPGVGPDEWGRIFDRFYRGGRGGQEGNHDGSGIGLSLAKELVELHGGSIAAGPTGEKGARFTVTLPSDAPQAHSSGATAPESSGESSKSEAEEEAASGAETIADLRPEDAETVLIIEDDAEMRSYLGQRLGESFRILEAPDAAAGTALAAERLPDLILSDVMMDGMDGLELCRRLKNDPVTGHIPVVLLTARQEESSQMEGLESGADDYIVKPFNMETLRARLRNLLETRRRLREKFSREWRSDPADLAENPADAEFLKRAVSLIEINLSDPEFGVEKLSREIGLSRSQLFRKMKALTSETPFDFIQTIRMRKAVQLLEKTDRSVTEIAYDVGYKYPSHFSQLFHSRLGKSPKEFRRSSK
jgi:signal transduction histidine kinase/ligand-binding sensor domain-containing protein/DNA-binding response OmpR family regulator